MIACSAAVWSRAIAASASLWSFAISCDDCASRFAFSICADFRASAISWSRSTPDFCARLIRVGTEFGSFLTGRNRVGQQLVRLFLPLGNDIHDRPKEEPGENPDENEDIDGLECQRPPIDMHGLSG